MTATKYPAALIERMRDAVSTLLKLDQRSTWTGEGDEPRIDPLLVEKQLITHMANDTGVDELEKLIPVKRAVKAAEEKEKRETKEKEYWVRGEIELLNSTVSLRPLLEWAEDQKDAPPVPNFFDRSYVMDRGNGHNYTAICHQAGWRLKDLDKWEHVRKPEVESDAD